MYVLYSLLELLDCVNVCCVGIDCFTKAIGLTSRFHTIIGGHQFSAGHSISYSTRRQNTLDGIDISLELPLTMMC